MRTRTVRLGGLLAGLVSTVAAALSFNVDVSPSGSTPPPDTYAAAGQAGRWVSITAEHGQRVFGLVDVDGVRTGASLVQIGGMETVLRDDPVVTGDDATLMNDCVITHTALENCVFMDGLEPGTYEVIIYARMPGEPAIESETFVDEEAGNPRFHVGGPWPGYHVELVSYACLDFGDLVVLLANWSA